MPNTRNIGDLERNKFYLNQDQTQTVIPYAPLFVINHNIPIADGNCSCYRAVNKFGRAVGVDTTEVDVTYLDTPATYAWLTSAVKLEAISTDGDDTAAGDGARTIVVQGLDANYQEVSETITMAGLSASAATDTEFLRIHRAYVATAGTYTGNNVGRIIIRTESAGATHIELAAGYGQSQVSRYTIPDGYIGYLTMAILSVDSNKSATFNLWRRENSDTVAAPFSAKRIIDTFDGLAAPFERSWDQPIKLPERTDVWMSVVAAGAGTNVSGSFDVILVATGS